MIDDPLDPDAPDDEQVVADALRRAPVPEIPDQVRERLEAALRRAQTLREDGECARAHTEALVAAALRTSLGTFGPNPIGRKVLRGRGRGARTIGA